MSRSKSDRCHKGHKAKKEYSGFAKCGAVGRRKQRGASYICPCCIKMGGMRQFAKIKTLSRRIVRRTTTIIIEEE